VLDDRRALEPIPAPPGVKDVLERCVKHVLGLDISEGAGLDSTHTETTPTSPLYQFAAIGRPIFPIASNRPDRPGNHFFRIDFNCRDFRSAARA
jgi:hypothetical protein